MEAMRRQLSRLYRDADAGRASTLEAAILLLILLELALALLRHD